MYAGPLLPAAKLERVQCRFHLGGDVLDEFCFQFVVLVGDTDGFLLLAGKGR